MASSLAKKTGGASTERSTKTCSDGGGGENECSDGETLTTRGRVSSKEPICYGCG